MKICCRLGIGRWMYFWGSVSRKVQEKSSQRYSWEWLHGLWYFRYLTIVNTCKYCKCKYNKIKHDFQYTSDVIISHPVFFEYWELSTSTSRETGSCNKVYCWEALYICFALFCINIYIYIYVHTHLYFITQIYDNSDMICVWCYAGFPFGFHWGSGVHYHGEHLLHLLLLGGWIDYIGSHDRKDSQSKLATIQHHEKPFPQFERS